MTTISDQDIKHFLETAPIYTWKEFPKPAVNQSSLWIEAIDSFCERCGHVRPFHDMRSRGGGAGMPPPKPLSSGTSYFEFTCVTCRKERREFLVEQILEEKTIKLQKYGELPRKVLERDKVLQKFFSSDSEYYEKAVVCLHHGYGIAAFAYFRRIVENNIFKLLDLIKEDAENATNKEEIKGALAELKKESPMSEKIKVANKALPEYLKPSGLNPLGRLYQVLSEGVHNLNDQECLEKTSDIQECLKYLISELSDRKKNQGRFKSMVASL
jgi:hypothetical protein